MANMSLTTSSLFRRTALGLSSVLLALGILVGTLQFMSVSAAQAHAAVPAAQVSAPTGTAGALTAGRYHTCFLNNSQEFTCWGDASEFPNSGSPNFAPLLITGTVQISAGDNATCALKTDGSIECWSPDSGFVNGVITTTTFTSVSVGTGHACALDTAGHIYCWGQLTNGLQSELISDTYKMVSAGDQNDCAILSNDKVTCWGKDSWTLPAAGSDKLKDLAVGPEHACGIGTDDSLVCWGNTPLTPPSSGTYTAIDSGSDYSCAMNSSNKLVCWGPNSPPVDTLRAFDTFSAGFLHTCALRVAAGGPYLACWGSNTYLQAPRLDLSPTSIPAYLPLNRAFTQTFTPQGGAEPYTLSMQGSLPGLTLNNWTLSGSPTTTGSYNFSLTLEENYPASSLPLELDPRIVSLSTQVQNAATSVSVSADPTQADVGMPLQVTVVVSESGTPALSGSVTITGTDTTSGVVDNTCTVAVAGSQAQCTLSFTTPGSKTFSARYNGDDFYLPSPANTTAVTIDAVTFPTLVSAGASFTCSLDSAGQIDCWGKDSSGESTPPGGVFSTLSAGDSHSCARSPNGSLSCWGWNGWGAATPPSGYTYSSVTAGLLHSCALNYSGGVTCWGYTADGRTTPPAGVTFSQISAGDEHTCGVTSSGTLSCWGRNQAGQASPPSGTYTQVSSGGTFSCALRASDSAVVCWGGNTTTLSSTTYQMVEVGRGHACAINSAGRLTCWGSNTYGQTTLPDLNQTYTTVSAGAAHTCALRSDGYLECWGSNDDGQAPAVTLSPGVMPGTDVNLAFSQSLLASGGRETSYTFSRTGSWPAGISLDANTGLVSGTPTQAGVYTYAIRAAERSLSPAFSDLITYTQIVRSDAVVQITGVEPITPMVGKPTKVSISVTETPGSVMGTTPSQTVTVTASDGTTCDALLQNGSGTCYLFFTASGSKQLQASYVGDSHFKPGATAAPTNLVAVPYLQSPKVYSSPAVTLVHMDDGSLHCPGSPAGAACEALDLPAFYPAVAIGAAQVCVLHTDGTIHCQAVGAVAAPLPTPPAGTFAALSVGVDHACALDPAGKLTCWGDNTAGKASPPAGVYRAVSASGAYTCGILSSGSLACWGSVPAGGPPAGTFSAVSAGPAHACAIRASGEIVCWGDDSAGQSTAPAGQFTAVATGLAHSCGLQADGRAACWGADADGQRQAPYGIFTNLAAADDHACALRSGPHITCWGGSDQGEAPAITVTPPGGSAGAVSIPALDYWEHGFAPTGGKKPYAAQISSGALPGGVLMALSPSGTILYGTPQQPGVFPFTAYWQDAAAVPLAVEQPYTITVTGVDLAVGIFPDHPDTALFLNPFTYQVVITNTTALDVSGALLTVTLPANLSSITTGGMAGCVQSASQVQCTLGTLGAGSSQTLVVSGVASGAVGATLVLSARAAYTQAGWPEIDPANNQAQSSVVIALTSTAFVDAFEEGPVRAAWSGGALQSAPGGVNYLGDFNGTTSLHLRLQDLPPHQAVRISFDLYVIGPWDGAQSTPPGLWQFGEDGQPPLLATTFSNLDGKNQSFPGSYPAGDYAWRTGSAGSDLLAYPGTPDTRYRLTFTLPHSAASLDLLFASLDLPAGAAWGIDNVSIFLEGGLHTVLLPVVGR